MYRQCSAPLLQTLPSSPGSECRVFAWASPTKRLLRLIYPPGYLCMVNGPLHSFKHYLVQLVPDADASLDLSAWLLMYGQCSAPLLQTLPSSTGSGCRCFAWASPAKRLLRLGEPSEATPSLDLSAWLLMYRQCSAPLLQALPSSTGSGCRCFAWASPAKRLLCLIYPLRYLCIVNAPLHSFKHYLFRTLLPPFVVNGIPTL